MYNCPIRKETCTRKRCYFWVNSTCAVLAMSKNLEDIVTRLDRLEKQQKKADNVKESH